MDSIPHCIGFDHKADWIRIHCLTFIFWEELYSRIINAYVVLAQLFTVPWIVPINCSTYCLSIINQRSALAWGCITDRICIYCLLFPGVAIAYQDFKHICIAYLQNWLQITVARIKLLITLSSFAQLLHWHWLCSRLNLHWLPNLFILYGLRSMVFNACTLLAKMLTVEWIAHLTAVWLFAHLIAWRLQLDAQPN